MPVQDAETTEMSGAKKRAALASVGCNAAVTLLKLVAALLTGSVSLLSDAVHSATDSISSFLALVSVRVSASPPDEEHPYGHGKIESLTGFAESILVFCAVLLIGYEAIKRLHSGRLLDVQSIGIGIFAMAFSAAACLLAALYVGSVGKKTSSTALQVNSFHLRTDFITSLGVFSGLLLTKLTGQYLLDPIIALLLAAWMAYEAVRMSIKSFNELIDVRLPEEEIEKVREILDSEQGVLGFHRLRTRLSGSVRNIDLHIVVPREWTVVEAHDLADSLEKRIREAMQPAAVVIHVDPYDPGKVRAGKSS